MNWLSSGVPVTNIRRVQIDEAFTHEQVRPFALVMITAYQADMLPEAETLRALSLKRLGKPLLRVGEMPPPSRAPLVPAEPVAAPTPFPRPRPR